MAFTPFIRPYNPKTDSAPFIHIFQKTAHSSLQSPRLLAIAALIWCTPYLTLHPSSCFTLDDGEGVAVGYILSTPDTAAFVQRYKGEFLPTVDKDEFPPPDGGVEKPGWEEDREGALLWSLWRGADELLHAEAPRLLEKYPAELHIDVLPSHQRQGHGKSLIEHLLLHLREHGVHGIHLTMAADNRGASKFYKAVGFQRFELDDGKGGEMGDGSECWVKAIGFQN